MKRLATASLAVSLSLVGYYPASAQALAPLSQIMGGEYEPSYPFVRCAAFYQASAEWMGTDNMPAADFERLDASIRSLVAAAIITRVERTGSTVDNQLALTMRDTRNVSDLYLARFEANYAATGAAWGNDPLWIEDSELCQVVAQLAVATGN